MKILLLSFTDSTNFGDQMIVEQLLNRLKVYGDIVTYSYSLKKNHEFEEFLKYEGKKKSKIKVIFDDKIRKISFVDRILAKRILKITDARLKKSEYESDIINSELLVIGGGNTIFDLTKHSSSAKKFAMFINIAKKHKKKIYLMDVGIGPFVTEKQLLDARELVKTVDYVSVRDDASFNLLKGLDNVYLGIDPVFSLPKKHNIISPDNSSTKTIGICIMDYTLNKVSQKEYKNYIKDMTKLIISIAEKKDIKIILFNSEIRDFESVKEIYNLIKCENVDMTFIGSKKELLKMYSDINLIIGTRMHSMIIAKSQEIPVIGLSWQPKVIEIFKMFDDEGSVFDINNFGNQIDDILVKIDEKLKENTKEVRKQESKIIQNREQVDIDNLKEINNEKI